MKKILFIFFVILINNTNFAQLRMNILKPNNSTETIWVHDARAITFDEVTFTCGGTIIYSGQSYNTILIGSQCWLKENLNVGTKINGSEEQLNNSTLEKYCYDNNETNCNTYGGLYQWAEAVQYQNGATNFTSPSPAFTGNVQGICPTGWHIPTKAEFEILNITVGDDGDILKDASGFSALFAGYRNYGGYGGNFLELGDITRFRSS
ncbi:MAG: FISUMP domain-containing protein, partial [bacterium]